MTWSLCGACGQWHDNSTQCPQNIISLPTIFGPQGGGVTWTWSCVNCGQTFSTVYELNTHNPVCPNASLSQRVAKLEAELAKLSAASHTTGGPATLSGGLKRSIREMSISEIADELHALTPDRQDKLSNHMLLTGKTWGTMPGAARYIKLAWKRLSPKDQLKVLKELIAEWGYCE